MVFGEWRWPDFCPDGGGDCVLFILVFNFVIKKNRNYKMRGIFVILCKKWLFFICY